MKHLKKFNKTFEGIRKEGEDVFIDGMSDENHILYPMIEELNNALRESNIEKMSDIINNVITKCFGIQYHKRNLTKDELDQSKCLANSLSNILDNIEYDDYDDYDEDFDDENGDNFENRREGLLDKDKLDAIIHDIVVNGKLWISRQNNRNGW